MIEMTLLVIATKNCFTQNKNLQYIIMGRKYDDRALFEIVYTRLHIKIWSLTTNVPDFYSYFYRLWDNVLYSVFYTGSIFGGIF